jgi:hypothetical protein
VTDAPIFVVGLPRSGTTLLTQMLAAHPRIAGGGGETHFFKWLPPDTSTLLDPARWPGPATDYVCSLRPGKSPKVFELYGRTREEIHDDLARRTPSVAAMLESLTEAYARAVGKPRWMEKSPGHLTRLPLLRRSFPEAHVIRIIRDPRDVALSLSRVPWSRDSVLANLYHVARRDRRYDAPARRDPRLLTVRFEDLVSDPEAVLGRICEFIGERLEPGMVAPKDRPARSETTRKTLERPDPSRGAAWRREMSDADQRAAAVICHEVLARHGYPGGVAPRRVVRIEPDGPKFVRRHEDITRRLAIAGVLVAAGGSGRPRRRSDLVFWARGGADPWQLGRSPVRRAKRLARMGALLVRQRLRRRSTTWVRPGGAPSTGRAAESLLGLFSRRMTPEAWLASLDISGTDAPPVDAVAPGTQRPDPVADLR